MSPLGGEVAFITGALKPVLTAPFGEREPLKRVPQLLAMMDAEVERLGRSTSARNVALSDVTVTPD